MSIHYICVSFEFNSLVQEERAFDLGPDIMRYRMQLLPKVQRQRHRFILRLGQPTYDHNFNPTDGSYRRPSHYLKQDVLDLQAQVQDIKNDEDDARARQRLRSLLESLEHTGKMRKLVSLFLSGLCRRTQSKIIHFARLHESSTPKR